MISLGKESSKFWRACWSEIAYFLRVSKRGELNWRVLNASARPPAYSNLSRSSSEWNVYAAVSSFAIG